jgi:hypothetical protein
VCRRASLALTPDLAAPSRARTWLLGLCERWGLTELSDDSALAASELVTNAVLHARTPLRLTAGVASSMLEVSVRDEDDQLPTVLPVRDDLASDIEGLLESSPGHDEDDLRHPSWVVGDAGSIAAGRGLHLLDAVADCWGVSALEGRPGKEVWFGLAVPERWAYAAACTCAEPGAQPLPSGHPVVALAGPWDR